MYQSSSFWSAKDFFLQQKVFLFFPGRLLSSLLVNPVVLTAVGCNWRTGPRLMLSAGTSCWGLERECGSSNNKLPISKREALLKSGKCPVTVGPILPLQLYAITCLPCWRVIAAKLSDWRRNFQVESLIT